MASTDGEIEQRYQLLSSRLDERQRRLFVATEARVFGRGGISAVSRATGVSRVTITVGLGELEVAEVAEPEPLPQGRVRRAGGGRKKLAQTDPTLLSDLEMLIDPVTRGDPESPLRWTCKSVRNLAESLGKKGHPIGRQSVANILHDLDYSLQSNRKTSEGKRDHPDRDDQFQYINRRAKTFLRQSLPVISVDTKKKELIGKYKNAGHEWEKQAEPIKVLSHDFPDPKVPKAVPHGVYDIGKNVGWVNVGMAADTAEFAVESIAQWWKRMGKARYPKTKELLICAASGGSNGYRIHLWKHELQKFCDRNKLKITVCHFPPGMSKWNKIEHRLFSYITMNWRGRPLTDYRTVVNLI